MTNSPPSPPKETKVSIILPAHNEEEHIELAIKSLMNQSYDKSLTEIIVIDNNSTDRTKNIAEALSVSVHSLSEGPVGRVRNYGAKLSSGEILFFLDADCIAPPSWLAYAVKRLENHQSLVLGGGYELRERPNTLEKLWLLDGVGGALLPTELLGGSIALHRKAYEKVGGFDETITSGEDSKLSQELRALKYTVEITREMSVIHLGNPTTLKHFFIRQIWHSENYFKNTKETLKDKTFLIVTFFAIALISTLALSISGSKLAIISAALTAASPAIFSIKRISRSGNYSHLKNFHKIYTIDLIYTLARCVGLIKGVILRLWLELKRITP